MPIWLIELFGAVDLDATFIVIALMTAPFWIAMIGFPSVISNSSCNEDPSLGSNIHLVIRKVFSIIESFLQFLVAIY